MNISRYISELIINYECVVLPGLGGFITNAHSATINRLTHEFKPPYNQLFFNIHLNTDDGLLVNYISRKENITYSDARRIVDEFVSGIYLKLQQGENIELEDIGSLFLDEGKNISFDQDFTLNYNTKSFGLYSFISPAIKRDYEEGKFMGLLVPEQRQRSKPVDRKPVKDNRGEKKKKRAFVRPSLIISLLALFVITIAWGLQNRDNVLNYWENQASFFPFNNTTPQYQPRQEPEVFRAEKEVLPKSEFSKEGEKATGISELPSKTAETASENQPVTENIAPAEKDPVKKVESVEMPDKEISIPKPAPSTKQYYIIAGSFGKEKNAARLIEQLKQKGFDAMIADTNSRGMFRVAYVSVGNLKLAKEKLQAIRVEDNADAWILKK